MSRTIASWSSLISLLCAAAGGAIAEDAPESSARPSSARPFREDLASGDFLTGWEVQLASGRVIRAGPAELHRPSTGMEERGILTDVGKSGPWATYEAGSQRRVQVLHYTQGQLDGEYLRLDESGTTVATGTYRKGRKDGIWQEKEHGGGITRAWYENDLREGSLLRETSSGTQTETYFRGRTYGPQSVSHGTGSSPKLRTLAAGLLHGPQRDGDTTASMVCGIAHGLALSPTRSEYSYLGEPVQPDSELAKAAVEDSAWIPAIARPGDPEVIYSPVTGELGEVPVAGRVLTANAGERVPVHIARISGTELLTEMRSAADAYARALYEHQDAKHLFVARHELETAISGDALLVEALDRLSELRHCREEAGNRNGRTRCDKLLRAALDMLEFVAELDHDESAMRSLKGALSVCTWASQDTVPIPVPSARQRLLSLASRLESVALTQPRRCAALYFGLFDEGFGWCSYLPLQTLRSPQMTGHVMPHSAAGARALARLWRHAADEEPSILLLPAERRWLEALSGALGGDGGRKRAAAVAEDYAALADQLRGADPAAALEFRGKSGLLVHVLPAVLLQDFVRDLRGAPEWRAMMDRRQTGAPRLVSPKLSQPEFQYDGLSEVYRVEVLLTPESDFGKAPDAQWNLRSAVVDGELTRHAVRWLLDAAQRSDVGPGRVDEFQAELASRVVATRAAVLLGAHPTALVSEKPLEADSLATSDLTLEVKTARESAEEKLKAIHASDLERLETNLRLERTEKTQYLHDRALLEKRRVERANQDALARLEAVVELWRATRERALLEYELNRLERLTQWLYRRHEASIALDRAIEQLASIRARSSVLVTVQAPCLVQRVWVQSNERVRRGDALLELIPLGSWSFDVEVNALSWLAVAVRGGESVVLEIRLRPTGVLEPSLARAAAEIGTLRELRAGMDRRPPLYIEASCTERVAAAGGRVRLSFSCDLHRDFFRLLLRESECSSGLREFLMSSSAKKIRTVARLDGGYAIDLETDCLSSATQVDLKVLPHWNFGGAWAARLAQIGASGK